jgi:hypothetical protein
VANQLSAIPWEVDTVGVLIASGIKVKAFTWTAPTSLGDELILHDSQGNVVLHAIAEADAQSQVYYKGGVWYDGLTLDTLDSGVLYIDFK